MTVKQLDASAYHPYYARYIDLVEDIPLLETLGTGMLTTSEFFESLPAERHNYRYVDGKWTPKEILQHLIDCERIFCYRALYAARDRKPELTGFDQDRFVGNGNANELSLKDLVEEYVAVRTASIFLFKNLPGPSLQNKGIANGNAYTVAALGFVIAGHEKHHCDIIRQRYLP